MLLGKEYQQSTWHRTSLEESNHLEGKQRTQTETEVGGKLISVPLTELKIRVSKRKRSTVMNAAES